MTTAVNSEQRSMTASLSDNEQLGLRTFAGTAAEQATAASP